MCASLLPFSNRTLLNRKRIIFVYNLTSIVKQFCEKAHHKIITAKSCTCNQNINSKFRPPFDNISVVIRLSRHHRLFSNTSKIYIQAKKVSTSIDYTIDSVILTNYLTIYMSRINYGWHFLVIQWLGFQVYSVTLRNLNDS